MYRATQQHCDDNATTIATVPAFLQALDPFKTKVSAIIATVQQEELVTKGVTQDKAAARDTLCHLAADIAAPIFAYAAKEKNNELKQQANFSYSDLLRSKDDQLAPRCQNILDAGTKNLAALDPYGITAATISSLQVVLDTYQAKVPNPRNAAAQKKTIRENLKELFVEADEILKDQMDKTALRFKDSNPDFLRTYKNNRIIIDPTKTTTQLKGVVTSSAGNIFIKGATIVIKETGTKATTNELGEYLIKPAPLGTYTINVSATGHNAKEESSMLIKQGQINKQDFSLDPA
jgi:hypothetical protein